MIIHFSFTPVVVIEQLMAVCNQLAGNDSFINNVSLEWKISEKSDRYIRLFYDKNYESLLEGEIIETGVGYVYKRKFNNLNELLIFRKKNKEEERPVQTRGNRPEATTEKKEKKDE